MRHLAIALTLLFSFTSLLMAETEVSGPLATQTWSIEGSPYILIDDVEVMADETLSIDPGVEILGHQGTVLWVTGSVIAMGTENQPILFSHIEDEVIWDGVRIQEATKPSYFEHCIFEYASTFHNHIHGGAVNLSGATATFRYCLFQYNHSNENSPAIYSNHSYATIEHCVFRWNDAGGSGAIGCDVGGTMDVSYSVFYENIADAAPVANFYPCDVTLDHLTIANNISRLPDYSAAFFAVIPVEMTNSIVQIPQAGVYSPSSDPYLNYACVWGPDFSAENVPGENMFFADPMFVDPDDLDFRLQPDSPCIDAGDPAFPPDPDGTITNLGALPVAGVHVPSNHAFLPDLPALPGEPILIPLVVSFTPDIPVISFQGEMILPMDLFSSFEGVRMADEGSFDLTGWSLETNTVQDTVHFAIAGSPAIRGMGPLLWIEAVIAEEAPLGDAPIDLRNIMANEGIPEMTAMSGTIHVIEGLLGDASLNGEVQAFDAGLILNHLTGQIELSTLGLSLAEVSGNGEVGAEDASLILQRVVGSIDQFPVQGAPLQAGQGQLSMHQEETASEHLCQVQIRLDNAELIRSGTIELRYPTNALQLSHVEYTSGADGLVEFAESNVGATIFLANAAPISGDDFSWVRLSFFASNTAPGTVQLTMSSAQLNDYIQLSESQGITLELNQTDTPGTPLPSEFKVSDAYPNPFNPSTTITIDNSSARTVRVGVYDMLGRTVATLHNGSMSAGRHAIVWQANGHASGVYLLRVEANGQQYIRKLILLH